MPATRCTYQYDSYSARIFPSRCTREAAPGLRCCAGHDKVMRTYHEERGQVWDGSVDADLTIKGHEARNRG